MLEYIDNEKEMEEREGLETRHFDLHSDSDDSLNIHPVNTIHEEMSFTLSDNESNTSESYSQTPSSESSDTEDISSIDCPSGMFSVPMEEYFKQINNLVNETCSIDVNTLITFDILPLQQGIHELYSSFNHELATFLSLQHHFDSLNEHIESYLNSINTISSTSIESFIQELSQSDITTCKFSKECKSINQSINILEKNIQTIITTLNHKKDKMLMNVRFKYEY